MHLFLSLYRVEIRGAATILDVNFTAKSILPEHDPWSQTLAELQILLRQSCRQVDSLVKCFNRTNKQRVVLETFANSLAGSKDNDLVNDLSNFKDAEHFYSQMQQNQAQQQQSQQQQQNQQTHQQQRDQRDNIQQQQQQHQQHHQLGVYNSNSNIDHKLTLEVSFINFLTS